MGMLKSRTCVFKESSVVLPPHKNEHTSQHRLSSHTPPEEAAAHSRHSDETPTNAKHANLRSDCPQANGFAGGHLLAFHSVLGRTIRRVGGAHRQKRDATQKIMNGVKNRGGPKPTTTRGNTEQTDKYDICPTNALSEGLDRFAFLGALWLLSVWTVLRHCFLFWAIPSTCTFVFVRCWVLRGKGRRENV